MCKGRLARDPSVRSGKDLVSGKLVDKATALIGAMPGNRLRATIGETLANFEPMSEDHEYLSTTLIGESEVLKIDQDGRVVLSDTIREYAGIADRVTFVGQGYKFQIWEPDRFVAYREEAKNRLRDIRKRLAPGHRATGVTARTGE